MSYVVVNGKLQKVRKNPWTGKRNLASVIREANRGPGYVIGENRMPEKDLSRKGLYMGLCNRSACLEPGADWYNRGSYAFYCEACADMLNHANRHDEFCKDAPLCRHISSEEECAGLHLSPSPYSPQ